MNSKKIRNVGIVIFFLCAIISLCSLVYISFHDKSKVDMALGSYTSGSALFENDEWYIDEAMMQGANDCVFLYGPVKPLSKGTYEILISYESESENRIGINANRGTDNSKYLDFQRTVLPTGKHTFTYSFSLKKDIDNWEISIIHVAGGIFRVSDIQILRVFNTERSIALAFFLLFLLAAFVLFFYPALRNKWNVAITLCVFCVVAAFPVFTAGIHNGTGLNYSLMRIEAVTQGIRNGLSPAVYSMDWLNGYGYPGNLFEGSLFFYIPALLRLLGFSIDTAYKYFLLFVNILTVLCSYYSFKHIFHSDKKGLLVTLIYLTAAYRYSLLYFQSNAPEALSFAFLPLLCLALHRIIKENKKSVSLMIIGFTGLLQSSMALALLAGVILLAILLVQLPKAVKNKAVSQCVLSFIGIILLNAYYLFPFIDSLSNSTYVLGSHLHNDFALVQDKSPSL